MRDIFAPPRRPGPPAFINAELWLTHVFSAESTVQGGVMRRKTGDVERIVGWHRFRAELRCRGYRPVINGGQVVVLCNAQPVQLFE